MKNNMDTTQLKQSETRVQQYRRRVQTQESKKFSFVEEREKLGKLTTSIQQQATQRFRRMSNMLDDRARFKSEISTKCKVKLPPLEKRYYKSRPTQLTQKEKLIQKITKRVEYGQKASDNYVAGSKGRVLISKYDQNIERFKTEENRKYMRILENLKKKQINFIQKPYVQLARMEIEKIKKSKSSMIEKFNLLNKIYHSYEKKDQYGMDEALELQTEANLALADLYLSQGL